MDVVQKLKVKKDYGLRDESKYKMSVGDGANLKYKRQGQKMHIMLRQGVIAPIQWSMQE